MKIRKKPWIVLLAIALAACITFGLTYAYVIREHSVTNRFTFGSTGGDIGSLSAMLTEPEWDGVVGYEYSGGRVYPVYAYLPDGAPVYGYIGGNISQPVTDQSQAAQGQRPNKNTAYGDELAQHILPGLEIPKNPIITNTSTTEEWVAMKVTFIYPKGHAKAGQPLSLVDYAAVTDVLEINYNLTAWQQAEESGASLVFYYRSMLAKASASGAAGGATQPLFTSVKVKGSAANAKLEAVQNLGGFVIYLEGFAAQGAQAASYAEFYAWGAAGGVVFEHTPTESKPASYPSNGIVPRV